MTTETMLSALEDCLREGYAGKYFDQRAIALIRTHGPALVEAVRDAERWRRFERDAEVVNQARGVFLESQVMFGRMDDEPRDYIDALIAIDQARAEGGE